MTDQTLPIYYPTSVLFVDDDHRYLKTLIYALNQDIAYFKTQTQPEQLVSQFADKPPKPAISRCIQHPEEDNRHIRHIDVNIAKIRQLAEKPDRHEEVSIVIVDYVMPSMDGLTLCEHLRNYPVKTVMLTGEADDKLATYAFNDGLIDHFIQKSDRDFYEHLENTIIRLQQEYFHEHSKILLNSLTQNHDHHPDSPLSSPKFNAFFQNFIKRQKIKEYFLCDPDGSFLLIDSKGKQSILAVKSEDAMLGSYELAKYADQQLPSRILESLKNNEVILYQHTSEDYRCSPENWKKQDLLHPAQSIQTEKTKYFWAHIK